MIERFAYDSYDIISSFPCAIRITIFHAIYEAICVAISIVPPGRGYRKERVEVYIRSKGRWGGGSILGIPPGGYPRILIFPPVQQKINKKKKNYPFPLLYRYHKHDPCSALQHDALPSADDGLPCCRSRAAASCRGKSSGQKRSRESLQQSDRPPTPAPARLLSVRCRRRSAWAGLRSSAPGQ